MILRAHEHAYAKQKGITHCFGARRRTTKYQDHIVLPLKNWDRICGVQTIDQAGCKKYTERWAICCGAYSDPEALIHIVEDGLQVSLLLRISMGVFR